MCSASVLAEHGVWMCLNIVIFLWVTGIHFFYVFVFDNININY